MPWRCKGVNVLIHVFLTSTLIGCAWSASRPIHITPLQKSPRYPLYRRLVDSTAGLDDMRKWKFLTLPRLELWLLGHSAHSQSLYWLCYQGCYIFLFLCFTQFIFLSFHLFLSFLPLYPLGAPGSRSLIPSHTFLIWPYDFSTTIPSLNGVS
jgi:hypothetical protein